MILHRFGPLVLLASVVVSQFGCSADRAAKRTAQVIAYQAVDYSVDRLSDRFDAAKQRARDRIHLAVAAVVRKLFATANVGFDGALTQVEVQLDQMATALASIAIDEMETMLDGMSGRATALWMQSIDEAERAVRRKLGETAIKMRESLQAAAELRVATDAELALSRAREEAWRKLKPRFDEQVALARTVREACIAAASAPATCEPTYQDEFAAARKAYDDAVAAELETLEDKFETAKRANRERLDQEALAKVNAWKETELKELKAQILEVRKSGRGQADRLIGELRGDVKKATARLTQDLRNRLKLTGLDRATLSEADITRLVNVAVDGFIDDLAERLKSALKKEMKKGVDEFLGK